jgi:predicted RNase H-like HicB family nuclease
LLLASNLCSKNQGIKTLQKRYPIQIHHMEDKDGEYYFAFLPDFGYSACSATGSTLDNALTRLNQVKEVLIRHYVDNGKPLPAPTQLPLYVDSGKPLPAPTQLPLTG